MNKEIIRMERLEKVYHAGGQDVRALDGINLSIRENEYVAVMGPSGSGKSTMMNILGCLDVPSGGTYLLDGTDVGSMDDDELSLVRNRKIGFVFQSFNLLPRYNALDNVALPLVYSGVPREERQRRAREALSKVGLSARITHRPNEMSGGQRQRVALARALVNNPSIILADEPTGNLDTRTSIDIMRLFEDIYREGNTIIVVTHEPDIAAYARRHIVLRDGLIETDTINERPTLAY